MNTEPEPTQENEQGLDLLAFFDIDIEDIPRIPVANRKYNFDDFLKKSDFEPARIREYNCEYSHNSPGVIAYPYHISYNVKQSRVSIESELVLGCCFCGRPIFLPE